MNSVVLIGRLTKDPELRYSQGSNTAIARFTLAVDREAKNSDQNADFIRITVFGKSAENVSKYLAKGRQCAVNGRIQTGSYQDKNGQTVYTTDVIANRVEFLGGNQNGVQSNVNSNQQRFDDAAYSQDPADYNNNQVGYQPQQGYQPQRQMPVADDYPQGFQAVEDDLPF